MSTVLKNNKLKVFMCLVLLISIFCVPTLSMAAGSMTVNITFPYAGTKDAPLSVSLADGQNMVTAFSYTGNPTDYYIVVVDENINTVWMQNWTPLAGGGTQMVNLPANLPKNTKLGVGVAVINFNTLENASAPYKWFVIQ